MSTPAERLSERALALEDRAIKLAEVFTVTPGDVAGASAVIALADLQLKAAAALRERARRSGF